MSCEINRFCMSSFLANGESKILSTLQPQKKGVVHFLALLDVVRDKGIRRTNRNLQRSFTLPVLLLLLMTGDKTRSMQRVKISLNIQPYPHWKKIVTFLCIHIMLFAGKLTINSCVFPLKGREEKNLSNCLLVLVYRWDDKPQKPLIRRSMLIRRRLWHPFPLSLLAVIWCILQGPVQTFLLGKSLSILSPTPTAPRANVILPNHCASLFISPHVFEVDLVAVVSG